MRTCTVPAPVQAPAPNALWTLPKDVDFAVQTVTHVPKLRQAVKPS
jgi:hypothetical protein